MVKKNLGTPNAAGLRLPSMGAQLTVGPASRYYRAVMTGDNGFGSAVTPSQMAGNNESDGETYDGAEMSADDGDDGDATDAGDVGDDGDESNDEMSGNEGTDDAAE